MCVCVRGKGEESGMGVTRVSKGVTLHWPRALNTKNIHRTKKKRLRMGHI